MSKSTTQMADDINSTTELWAAINVGDMIQIEADLIEEGVTILSCNRFYKVLAKIDRQNDAYFDAFVVQSNFTEQLINLSPAFITSYEIDSDNLSFS